MYNNKIALFGLFVGIDMWEVYTTSTVNMCNMYSIYIGHHNPFSVYNVVLPSSAFSESHCIFLNILGMVQRTMNAVKSPVKEQDMVQTTDIILCSLLRYILDTVKLPRRSSEVSQIQIWTEHEFAMQSFRLYFPHSLNYISDVSISMQLLNSSTCILSFVMYITQVRSSNSTDIISKYNVNLYSNEL